MKIAIDYSLAENHSGGMSVFIKNLTEHLNKKNVQHKYLLINNPIKFNKESTIKKLLSAIHGHLWYQLKFTRVFKKSGADILYSPNPPIPFVFNKPIILTIPDMAFYLSDNISFFSKAYLFILYFLSAHKASIITTFSENSKKDIVGILKVDPHKIIITPLAASKIFKIVNNTAKQKKVLRKYFIKKPYILSTPGAFLPRKNIKDLIIAFDNLPKEIQKQLQLVLVGDTRSSNAESLHKLVKKLKLSEKIIFTGYLRHKDHLIYIYNGAKIFAFPSLYEGFGLPPLEAMQCGIPTIVYNKSSLPEVVGSAAIKVSNSKQLSKAIVDIFCDKHLQIKLAKDGIRKSKCFSWSKTATMYVKIFNSYQ